MSCSWATLWSMLLDFLAAVILTCLGFLTTADWCAGGRWSLLWWVLQDSRTNWSHVLSLFRGWHPFFLHWICSCVIFRLLWMPPLWGSPAAWSPDHSLQSSSWNKRNTEVRTSSFSTIDSFHFELLDALNFCLLFQAPYAMSWMLLMDTSTRKWYVYLELKQNLA